MSKPDFTAKRLQVLPPYLFVEIDKAKRLAREQGEDIIDLGIGDPDQPAPDFVVEALQKASQDGANHHYALDAGLIQLRQEIAVWYKNRFGVSLDPDNEIYPLIGSKEGLAHLPLSIINPGEKVFVPDPAYPVYNSSTIFAAGEVNRVALLEKNGFLPDIERLGKAKLMFLNYPNNPTAATADEAFYTKLVNLSKKQGMFLAADMAYSEIYFDNNRPMSILQIEGARDVAIEFHSLSKTFNMTGWRIGWACGNAGLVQALAKVKTNIDSGIFQAIQIAGLVALKDSSGFSEKMRQIYQQRRDVFVEGLNRLGWEVEKPRATFYVWARVPTKENSMDFAKRLLKESAIVATPGIGFGHYGEGYIRFSLTLPKERLNEALERISRII